MAWTERNVGLEDQRANYITQHPATRHLLDSSFHELWAATGGGVFHTVNGGRQWAEVTLPDPDNSQFLDLNPPRVVDVSFIWIDYDPTNSAIIYTMGECIRLNCNRTWIYKTTDSGLTWTSKGVTWL